MDQGGDVKDSPRAASRVSRLDLRLIIARVYSYGSNGFRGVRFKSF